MFPFGGILTALDFELLVPGQDSQDTTTFISVAAGPSVVRSGVRFGGGGSFSAGRLYKQLAGGSWQLLNSGNQQDMWINSDVQSIIDPADYEARFIYQSGDGLGELQGNANNTWFDCDTEPFWGVQTDGSAFDSVEIFGLLQVRNKVDTGTIRTGDIRIYAEDLGF